MVQGVESLSEDSWKNWIILDTANLRLVLDRSAFAVMVYNFYFASIPFKKGHKDTSTLSKSFGTWFAQCPLLKSEKLHRSPHSLGSHTHLLETIHDGKVSVDE